MSINRRDFVRGALATGAALGASACVPPDQSPSGRLVAQLRIIEAAANGTLGVELFDTVERMSIGLNSARRFGHCSSFKLSLAAKVLADDAGGLIDADRRVTWTTDDLMPVSPFTTKRLEDGATLRELAEFTQKYSDNAAANILLRELGGPAALTAFWREIGDQTSRLDRTEMELNNVPVTEFRDTTTPAAMARTVARLVYGDVLPDAQRETLKQWMIDTTTGVRRVRAGLPESWLSGDKTGTSLWPGMGSLYVDIGFVEPARTAPITFAAYFRAREQSDGIDPAAEEALARVGEVLATMGEKQDWIPF
ncbi:MAG: class A beta-lactamase [Erythrobacter sp.]|uniref:class A beta-lactamase n=1 Tax=Erythrobacter sp. TaxID=1042 RepID=UPI002624D365|nr:class A beta-lactamase [Erythrobacter sp.]MDJ0979272.1 class A beta-lactamase [Erythrobacter sp.]